MHPFYEKEEERKRGEEDSPKLNEMNNTITTAFHTANNTDLDTTTTNESTINTPNSTHLQEFTATQGDMPGKGCYHDGCGEEKWRAEWRRVYELKCEGELNEICGNCFRETTLLIPSFVKAGKKFTKSCVVCGYEEECTAWGDVVTRKDVSTQTNVLEMRLLECTYPDRKFGRPKTRKVERGTQTGTQVPTTSSHHMNWRTPSNHSNHVSWECDRTWADEALWWE